MRFSLFTAALLLSPVLHAEQVGPWDLDALKNNVPTMKWVRQDQPIQSLTYSGEKYQGHDTEVFAFYASPITIGEAKPGAKFPGVVLIHGGAWLFGTRYQLHWYGSRLARAGYVAASINYRMLPMYPFPYCIHDCKAAVRWLRLHADEYGIDPERIAAFGNSAGGHLAGLLATTRPRDWRAWTIDRFWWGVTRPKTVVASRASASSS